MNYKYFACSMVFFKIILLFKIIYIKNENKKLSQTWHVFVFVPNNSASSVQTVVCSPRRPENSRNIDLFKWRSRRQEYLIWAQSSEASLTKPQCIDLHALLRQLWDQNDIGRQSSLPRAASTLTCPLDHDSNNQTTDRDDKHIDNTSVVGLPPSGS